jgi:hypothetical protein
MLGWLTGSGAFLFVIGILIFGVASWLKIPLANVFLAAYLCLLIIGAELGAIGIFAGRRSMAKMNIVKAKLLSAGRDAAETLIAAKNVFEARRWLRKNGRDLLAVERSRRIFVSWVMRPAVGTDWRTGAVTHRFREIAWKEAEPSIERR